MGIINQYPYTDFHELNLDFVLNVSEETKNLNEQIQETVTEYTDKVDTLEHDFGVVEQDFTDLSNQVNNYFNNLDVQDEIDDKLDRMASDGTLETVIEGSDAIPDAVGDWLQENLTPTTPAVDNTLSVANAAADSKKVGDVIWGSRDKSKNDPRILTFFNDFASLTNITDMPENSYCISSKNALLSRMTEQLPLANITYIIKKIRFDTLNANPTRFELIRLGGAVEYVGYMIGSDTDITWTRVFTDIDSTLTQAGQAADAKVTGDNVFNLDDYNVLDLMRTGSTLHQDRTSQGCTYEWADNNTVNISGTSTGSSFCNIINSQSVIPAYIHIGDDLLFDISSAEGTGITIHGYFYPNTLAHREFRFDKPTLIHVPEGAVGLLFRLEVANGTVLPVSGVDVTVRILNGNTPTRVSNVENTVDSVSILVFGNSFTYSTIGYVPRILKDISPSTRVTIGILYKSGADIQDHIDYFNNNTAYTEYSEYDWFAGKWYNTYNSRTAKSALGKMDWDYICIHQGYKSTAAEIKTWCDLILGYVTYPFTFLMNMGQSLGANCTFPAAYTQATGAEKSDAMFDDIMGHAADALDGYLIADILPGCTAVQNARQIAAFQSIGTYSYLCDDAVGHLQNGIGPLIAGYAVAYKLLQIIGHKDKLFCQPWNPTDTFLQDDYDLYTATSHGSCTGVSNSNKLLAQKCALAAIKDPMHITSGIS